MLFGTFVMQIFLGSFFAVDVCKEICKIVIHTELRSSRTCRKANILTEEI